MKRRLLVLLLVLAAFASCRKQVADFEYPDFEATPTLNAILAEGKPVWAQVSLTQRLDSIHPAICSDAEWTFSIYNAYCRQNPYYYYYGDKIGDPISWGQFPNDPPQLWQRCFFPIIPSFSYKVWF